jgi:2-polyprenyl-3-methyl-5-hydroxy-6-metoxy-1,4-benzoquinol methylase
MTEARADIVDLFARGAPMCRDNNFGQLFNLLKWRQKYQKSDIYELELMHGKRLYVKQILNGEMKGLGTGTQVWPAAHVLVKFLELRYRDSGGLRGKRVCDIGTGTGITGFAAADLGGEVTLTDQEHLLPFLEENRALVLSGGVRSAATVMIKRYDWGENAVALPLPFDVVLVSDCVLPKLYPIDLLVRVSFREFPIAYNNYG